MPQNARTDCGIADCGDRFDRCPFSELWIALMNPTLRKFAARGAFHLSPRAGRGSRLHDRPLRRPPPQTEVETRVGGGAAFVNAGQFAQLQARLSGAAMDWVG